MNIDRFRCDRCQEPVPGWLARRETFQCSTCGQGYRSNYRASLKRSAINGCMLWLLGAGVATLLFDTWQLVLVFALEFGPLLAFSAAFLMHRLSIKVMIDSSVEEAEVGQAGSPTKRPPC